MAGRKPTNSFWTQTVTMSRQDHISAIERMNGMEYNIQQLRDRIYCDVSLRASVSGSSSLRESEPLHAHKIILDSASAYFERVFEAGEPNQINFTIPGIKRSALEFLLDCIYNCEVGVLTHENMFHIYTGAKILELYTVRAACEDFMEKSRTIDNCLELWTFGRREGCDRLHDPTFIIQNLEKVSETDYFSSLTKDEVNELISSAESTINLSGPILLTLHKWMTSENEREIDERVSTFLSLIRKVPREDVDHNVFAKIFIEDVRLKNNEGIQKYRDDYLCDFLARHLKGEPTTAAARSKSTSSLTSPKVPRKVNTPVTTTPAVGDKNEAILTNSQMNTTRSGRGRAPPEVKEKVSQDNERSVKRGEKRPPSRPPRDIKQDNGPLIVNGKSEDESTQSDKVKGSRGRPKKIKRSIGPIPLDNGQVGQSIAYYIANKDGTRIINSYDFQTGETRRVGKFHSYRENGVFMIVDKYIYYLGGRTIGEGEDSNRIDLFDLETKTWQSSDLLELDEGRCYFNCAVLDNQIYIVAGFRDHTCIDSVERIPIGKSTVAVESEEVTKVRWPKNRSPLAVIKGKVYSIGGAVAEGGQKAWASAFVECYDPLTNKWMDVKRMPTPRVGHAVVVLDSKLYALGGARNEAALPVFRLTTVEVYDPATDQWETRTSMKKKRQYGSAFAFGGYIYAVGGDSNKYPTIERYDPQSDSWQLLSSSTLPAEADYSSMIFQVSELKTQ